MDTKDIMLSYIKLSNDCLEEVRHKFSTERELDAIRQLVRLRSVGIALVNLAEIEKADGEEECEE